MTKSAYLIALVQACLALAVLFGVDLSADQIAGILAALTALLAFVAAWHDPQVPFGRVE